MADDKKKKKKRFNPRQYDLAHLQAQYDRAKAIEAKYNEVIAEAQRIAESTGFNDAEKEFKFEDYPSAQKRMDDLMSDMSDYLTTTIEEGDKDEWQRSTLKNDAMVDYITANTTLSAPQLSAWKQSNLMALSAFQQRKIEGMGLSKRVWNLTDQLRQELELALDLGLGEGKSAAALSRDVRQYLNEPNRLFRRVRDKHGMLRLSKAAKAYHPGRGVYRSSYKNALRLTATENNMAYRTADHLRWQQMPFVIGIEIKLSNNHTCKGVIGRFVDICDDLAGVYPKEFKFVGWHPHCRCFAIAKMASAEECNDYFDRREAGEDVSNYQFNGKVKELPQNFQNWYTDNADRIAGAKSQPYFLRDNVKLIEKNALSNTNKSKSYSLKDALLNWNVTNPEKFNNGIADKFDWKTFHDELLDATSKHNISIRSFDAEMFGNKMIFYVSGRGFYLERTFSKLDSGILDVRHDYFTLDDKYQGKGLSKDVFRALYKQYKNVGVDQMTVFANIDVGGYTWARYGFYAIDKRDALGAVKSDKAKKFIEKYYKDKSLKSTDPFPMRLLTEQTWGKNELKGSYWEGILNLRDDKARKVFEDYLGI